jgi:hypothetical protein
MHFFTNREESMTIDAIKTSAIPLQSVLQNAVQRTTVWGKVPLGKSPIYKGISNAATNGLENLAEKAGEVATKNVAAEGFVAKWAGKIAGYVAPAADKTKDFLGKMNKVASGALESSAKGSSKLFTKGNVAIMAAFEAPDVIEGFKEGRGIRQTIQSATKVGTGVAGGLAATVGAGMAAAALGLTPAGWVIGAVGLVGGAIGYMVGDKATSFLGKNKKGLFEKEAPQAVATEQQLPQQFGTMTGNSKNMPFGPYSLENITAGLPATLP